MTELSPAAARAGYAWYRRHREIAAVAGLLLAGALALVGFRACVVGGAGGPPPAVGDAAPTVPARYALSVAGGGKWIHLRGELEAGVTRAVAQLLDANPQARGIILDSGGGQIYEGRGLARVIRERGLATYTLLECASACATAFLAGRERVLGRAAKLGFHQYQSHTVIPAFDIKEEQDKDRRLFEAQGIAAEFLDNIFAARPEDMWWPTVDELRAGGVVHRTGFSLGDGDSDNGDGEK